MSDEIELDSKTLLSHAQWLATSLQSSVEGILNRAGVLISATGVELGILPNLHGESGLRRATAITLGVVAALLAFSMRPMKRRFPKTSDLREVYNQQRHADLTALVHMIGVEKPEDAWMEQLQQEVNKRAFWYRLAVVGFVSAQVPVVLMIWRMQSV